MLIRHAARGLLALAASVVLCAPAHAQLFRAYLSVNGSDSSSCTLPSPCRLLPAALSAVASGGEIWMLDSANYNTATVNITKSVTILAVPGVVGSVVATGGDAFVINTAGVNVALRNLVIVPLPGGGGVNGITFTSGASLVVEDCLVANLPGKGINIQPSTYSKIRIAGSTVRGNSSNGIAIQPTTGTQTTTFDIAETKVDGNSSAGILIYTANANSDIAGTIRNSHVSQNGDNGIGVESASGSSVIVTVSHTSVTNNALNGIIADFAPTKVFVAGSTIAGNGGVGLWASSGGIVDSAGNNEVRHNTGGNSSGLTTGGIM